MTTNGFGEHAVLTARLREEGEWLAAGFLELPDASVLRRMARGLRRQLEEARVPQWRGEALYPVGAFSWYAQGSAVTFSYSYSLTVDRVELAQRSAEGDAKRRATYAGLLEALGDYPRPWEAIDPDISLGGRNYTHSIINYGRVVREGLSSYALRAEAGLGMAQQRSDDEGVAFYEAMLDVLAGMRSALARGLETTRGQEPEDTDAHKVWERLIRALERVPWEPARDFYEGLVAANALYYLDGGDNLGRFDQDLGRLYEADLRAGAISEVEGEALVARMWDNMDDTGGFNVAIGGSTREGVSAANRLTLACIRAAAGRRRPNLALRLASDAPEEVLDAALDTISAGSGIPALYNDSLYRRAIRQAHLNVAYRDEADYAFGGCTELMVHGCSNVGSLDAGLNLPLILSRTLEAHLASAESFEELWCAFADALRGNVARLADQVSRAQEGHARWLPQPIRTLLVDDCLDAGHEFNAGGARYNWSVINVGGLGNVADALAAVREVVYERRELSGAELWPALEANYTGYDSLRERLATCPRYGNDDALADELAARVAELVFEELRRYAPWRGGRFLPSCLMFVTYADAGLPVMATPDGRRAGEPIADSIGAVQGRDRRGPTALIRSVAGIPQHLAPGTLVTNFRFAHSMFEGENRRKLKDLIRTYFQLGGMQAQITVVDQRVLQEAVEHPERHGDLIVRVGGYSEYWRNLTPTLRETVLQRTEHSV